jgi:hypothetical protein
MDGKMPEHAAHIIKVGNIHKIIAVTELSSGGIGLNMR